MKLLHMVTKSLARTPTFTMFGNDNYFFFTASGGDCVTGRAASPFRYRRLRPSPGTMATSKRILRAHGSRQSGLVFGTSAATTPCSLITLTFVRR